jgi:methionyl-tRNA formyltransferase
MSLDPPSSAGSSARYHGWRIALLTVSSDLVVTLGDYLRARGHELAALVLPAGPDGSRPRHAEGWSVMHQLLQAAPPSTDILIASRRDHLAPLLTAVRPDFLLSFFFPWRIPPEALALPPLGAVNAHPSVLPRYRGPNPLGWTLRSDEPELGLTFHRMDARFDTGPLLAQGRRPIDDADTVESIMQKLLELAEELMPEVLSRVAWGDAGEPQPETGASYAGHFEDAYREVDWSQPARAVHVRVRACRMSSWRGGMPHFALATLEGRRVQVLQTRLASGEGTVSAPPGAVLARQGGALLVQCGDAPLWVLQHAPWSG